MGLKCYYVGGWLRGYDGLTPKESNHAWNCFEFDKKILVPADMTGSAQTLEQAVGHQWKTGVELILPRTPVTWELFLARHFGVIKFDDNLYSYFDPASLVDPLSTLTFGQWRDRSIVPLLKLQRQLDNLEVH